jgi:hypothetical protein
MAAAGASRGTHSIEYIDFALRHPYLPWDWHTMTDTIIAADAMHMVLENADAPWDWVWLSHKVPLATILSMQDLPWYWKEVTRRAAYDPSIAFIAAPWDFEPPAGSSLFVAQHPYLDWKWDVESRRVVETGQLDLVERYPNSMWDHSAMSRVATIDDIMERPVAFWDWNVLSTRVVTRRGLTFQDVFDNAQWPWLWEGLSAAATLQQVDHHPDLPWYWYFVSDKHGSVTNLLQYPHLPWDLRAVAMGDAFRQASTESLEELRARQGGMYEELMQLLRLLRPRVTGGINYL